MAASRRGPSGALALLAAGVGLLYVFLAAEAAGLVVGLALKIWLGLVKIPFGFALKLILWEWKIFLLPAFVLLSFALYEFLKHHLPKETPGRGRLHWFVPLAVAIGALIRASEYRGRLNGNSPRTNRFGFFPSLGINSGPYRLKSGNPSVPDMVVKTNSFGFRDREWDLPLRERGRRALVVGDSFVWGLGIPSDEGMLHRRLERELNARGGPGWRVFNLATSPAALWYYAHALIAVGREVRPELYVMSVVGNYDLEPWEVQRVKFGLPARMVALMDAFHVSEDLMRLGSALGHDYEWRSKDGREIPPEVLADHHGSFSKLVAFVGKTGARLIVWEGLDRRIPFFDGYRADPGITFMGWKDVPELSGEIGGQIRGGRAAWTDDETLAYKGDGHPTPKANGLIAQAIACGVLRKSPVRSER